MAELEKMSGEALVDGFGNASIGTNDARWRELRAELLRRLSECEGLREERDELRGYLQELRIHYHTSGRRPEECYEMSLIDEALRARTSDGR